MNPRSPWTHPVVQLALSKVRELVREPEALFWVFAFPVLLALALGIAFRGGRAEPLPVGVVQGPGAQTWVERLEVSEDLEVRTVRPDEAGLLLRDGKLALVVVPGSPPVLEFDEARPESRLARLAVEAAALRAETGRTPEMDRRPVDAVGGRYIDFLIPGLLGMNLMGTGMWGIGFYVVQARSKKLLKRLVATPMRKSHFLLGQLLGRLVFLVPEAAALLLFGRWVFGVPMEGSWTVLAAVCVLGALVFGGLGLLVASRPRTIEGVSGLMNLVMMPMWILSGIFFSTERFPDVMQPLVHALPLTAVNDALRAVMLDGAGWAAIAPELAVVGAWTAGSVALALAWFRWR